MVYPSLFQVYIYAISLIASVALICYERNDIYTQNKIKIFEYETIINPSLFLLHTH